MNEIEQYSRNKNVEIKGVEEVGKENLKEIVVSIADKLGVNMSVEEIDVIHRVNNRNNREPRDIIVQFKRREIRDSLLQVKKVKINNIDITKGKLDKLVYINEHLTPYNKMLFWEARKKSNDKGFRFVWIKNGKIFVRKHETEKAHRIQNEDDLKKIE